MNAALLEHLVLNPGYDIDAIRAMNTMSGLTGQDKRAIDILVKGYKQFGLWTKVDFVHIHALSQALAARVNIKNPGTYNLTPVNTVTHTPYQGTAGDASSSYFLTGFQPSLANGAFQRDSAHLKVYERAQGSLAASRAMISGGISGSGIAEIIYVATTGFCSHRVNANTLNASTTLGLGHLINSRTASNVMPLYRDGVFITDPATASTALQAPELAVHARNLNGTFSLFHNGQISMTGAGGGLTANEALAMYQVDFQVLRILGAV